MTLAHNFTRTFGQFLPTGTTPLAATTNNTMTAHSSGGVSYSSLRLRTDIELYIVAGGGTAGVDLSFAYETLIVVGGFESVAGALAVSPTPLTTPNITPTTNGLGNWGQWDYLYPTIDFVDTLVPQLVVVTWRPKDKTIDTQFRRRSDQVAGIDLWMPWEIQDGSGLINTTDAHGNTYHLGARFAQAWEWTVRS
jgi:hypothetical protein